ncbi:MAG: hypothetical protein U0667_05645 [Chloroflexota bacterium]
MVRWTTDPTDLTPAETTQARALLASCPECAALSADLEVISRAIATSVVPPRPRDFRLTPQRAAASQGSVLDRLRRWLASPGSFAVRPLAGAALAIGLILVVVAPNLHSSVTGLGDDAGVREVAPSTAATMVVPAPTTLAEGDRAAKETDPPQAPDGAGPEVYAATAPSGSPSTQSGMTMRAIDSPAPTQAGDTAMAGGAANASPGADAGTAPDGGAQADEDGQGEPPSVAVSTTSDATTFALTLLGIVLAGTGLMVLVFAWAARRWQDPLLR